MALTCYMIFGRLIAQTDPRYSYVRPSRVTKTFIGFDVLSFVVQGAGGALYAGKRNLFTTALVVLRPAGIQLMYLPQEDHFDHRFPHTKSVSTAYTVSVPVRSCLASLVVFAFGCFFVFAIIYQVRARRGGVRPGAWSKLLYTLYLM